MIGLDELKRHGEISGADDDALLQELEPSVVAFVEGYTKRYFGAPEEVTEIVEGQGVATLFLGEEPDTDLDIAVIEQAYPGATQTTIAEADADGFVVRGRKLVRKGGHAWRDGYEYLVTYTRGYAQTDPGPPPDIAAPDDIRGVTRKLTLAAYREVKRKDQGLTQESLGDRSYSKGAPFAFQDGELKKLGVFTTLEHWRRWRV